ncbi:MAG: hypothetical protein U0235_23335 [Polyangiaceae bacterium]
MPPKLVDSAPSGTTSRREPLLYAAFDQKIDPAAVLKKLTLKAEGLDFGARLATAAELAADEDIAERVKASEKKGKGRTLVFKPARTLPPNTVVEITFPVGTPSAEGPRVTTEPQKMELTTHRALEVLAASTRRKGAATRRRSSTSRRPPRSTTRSSIRSSSRSPRRSRSSRSTPQDGASA